MNYYLLLIPIISAFLGWVFSKMGTYFLLHKYLPKQKEAIANFIAKKAETLLPFSKIENQIKDPALVEKTMPAIEAHIDEFLAVKLPQEIPMLAMFVGNKTTDKIKEVFVNQLRELFPKVMVDVVGNLKASFNIETSVKAALLNSNFNQFGNIPLAAAIQKIHFWGILTGLIIGSINSGIFYLFIKY